MKFERSRLANAGVTRAVRALVIPVVAALMVASPAWASIYSASDGAGPQGNLLVDSGTLNIDTGDGVSTPTISGAAVATGEVDDGVAVFRFVNVSVTGGTVVNVTGSIPLAITSLNDMVWNVAIDASDGVLGGGVGGAAGAGALDAGVGGAGATTAGVGAAATSGGAGVLGADGLPGAPQGTGGDGEAGEAGTAGSAGQDGTAGTLGTGSAGGSDGTAGAAGLGGAAGDPAAAANAGTGGASTGQQAAGGAAQAGAAGNPGQNATELTIAAEGNAGGAGAAGGDGGTGSAGGDASFTTPANSPKLVGGVGGGGGGGGGTGAGGQGGGSGGGGASGAAGGGGGGVDAPDCTQTSIPTGFFPGTDATGGTGASGGSGGEGGAGGAGGSAGPAGDGGAGANGGGAVLLSARGLLQFSGSVDVSAGVAGAGLPGTAAVAGTAGTAGTAGGAPGTATLGTTGTWRIIQGGYCLDLTGDGLGVANAGDGGAGQPGGAGGVGGAGGASGASGDGGDGGFGTPGMVKLHGSVVLASGGGVLAGNAANASFERNGKLTIISNMTDADEAANLPDVPFGLTVGSFNNFPVLAGGNSFDTNLGHPVIGELVGGVAATEGILSPGFWNETEVLSLVAGTQDIEVIVIPAGSPGNPFEGWDQIFVINNSSSLQTNVGLEVNGVTTGLPTTPAGNLQPGAIFTTTVVAGSAVAQGDPRLDPDGEPIPAVPVAGPLALALLAAGMAGGGLVAMRRKRA